MDETLMNLINTYIGPNIVFSSKEIASNREIRKHYSIGSVRTTLCKMSKDGRIVAKFSHGHYYIVSFIKGTPIPKVPSSIDTIEKKYLGFENEFGYYTGEAFANYIGLSENIPGVLEIVTNKEKSRGRYIYVGAQKVKIKKPLVKVTKENSAILPILDLFSEKGFRNIDTSLVMSYCKKSNISMHKIENVYSSLPSGAKRRCHIGGLLNGTI